MTRQESHPEPVQLSPEAALELDRALDEWRSRVLAMARREQANRAFTRNVIHLSDVSSALSSLDLARYEAARREVSAARLLRLLGKLTMAPLILVASLLLYYIARGLGDSLVSAIGVAGGSLAIIFSTYAFYTERRSTRYAITVRKVIDTNLIVAEFLAEWGELEVAIREVVGDREGADSTTWPLGAVFKSYAQIVNLSEDEIAELRALLHSRNAIVHSPSLAGIETDRVKDQLPHLERQLARALSARHGDATGGG